MPGRTRAPRKNPLIPVTESTNVPAIEQASPAPICGACFPAGWPEGGDYASCPHGDWSTNGRPVAGPSPLAPGQPALAVGTQFLGVTTDGTPVVITWRGPSEPALVSLVSRETVALAARVTETDPGKYWPHLAEPTPAAASPFAPPESLRAVLEEVDPAELDTGDDVMFMPSGG